MTDFDDTSPARRSKRPWATIVLWTSICLNAGLIAYIGGQWLFPERRGFPTIGAARLIEIVTSRLPNDEAAKVLRIYESKRPVMTVAQRDYEAALAAAVAELGRPELDMHAFRAAVRDARDKRIAVGDLLIETVIEAFAEMSPETRRRFVGRLRSR